MARTTNALGSGLVLLGLAAAACGGRAVPLGVPPDGGGNGGLDSGLPAPDGSLPDSGVACTYDGHTYTPGMTFPAADGCNTCACETGTQTPSVSCTKRACMDAAVPQTCPSSAPAGLPCMPVGAMCSAQPNTGCTCLATDGGPSGQWGTCGL